MQLSQTFPYLEISFLDPDIVPVGKWSVFEAVTKKKILDLAYDLAKSLRN